MFVHIAISAFVVCAISMTVLPSSLSYGNVGNDVKLFLFAIVACFVSFCLRLKPTVEKESAPIVQPDVIQFDVGKHIELMTKFAWERNIGGTMSTFRLIKQSGSQMTSLMFNTVLQACVNCGNVQAAEDWMDEMKEAGMADLASFNILIKTLVAACTLEKANNVVMKDMVNAGVKPGITAFNELLSGFARERKFPETCCLLDDMNIQGVQPTNSTLNTITKLIDGLRDISSSIGSVEKILSKCSFEANVQRGVRGVRTCISCDTLVPVPVPLPCLASAISNAKNVTRASCTHEIRLSGSLPQMKAARRTLKQLGFLDKSECKGGPLDGHWETGQGFTVVIEGKIVRWSARNASKLRYTRDDRCACVLTLYGEASHGHLEPLSQAPEGSQVLKWDNGDVWYPCDGRAIGQNVLFSQTMTKTLRDTMQDQMYRSRAKAVLKCVSKQALYLPSVFEDAISQFLGNDMYYISTHFESRWNPSRVDEDELPLFETSEDICVSISRRHPRVGLRHCWADRADGRCGQRTWVNGEELDDYCFNRHVGAVFWA